MKNGELMRLAVALSLVLSVGGLARAEAPEIFMCSGRLTDTSGATAPDASYPARFRFWDAARGGMELWLEQQTIVTRAGMFNAELGFGMPLDERFFADLDELWLEVEIDGDVLSPRVRVNSVPWAIRARSAGSADAVACGGCIGAGVVDNSAIQLRVSSECSVGSAIRAIHADGTVECQALSSGAGAGLETSVVADATAQDACFMQSGCAQSTYVGKTAATFTGAIGGYTAMHRRCQAEFPNSRACTGADIMRAHACDERSLTLIARDFGAWYADGTSHNECNGFQSDAAELSGRVWTGPQRASARGEGHASAASCNAKLPILCCRL